MARCQAIRERYRSRAALFNREEIRRLTNASSGAFRLLITAATHSGCRYGELTRLRCGDFNIDNGSRSKSGKSRHVILTDEGTRFFSTLGARRPTDALMLTREDGMAWGQSDQILPMATMARANIACGSFYTLRHSYASLAIMGGCPLHVVARNLGHSDTRMVEKQHYGHLSQSYITDAIRKSVPNFDLPEVSNLVPMRG